MKVNKEVIEARQIRLTFTKEEKEIARAYLCILKNDLHDRPFGLLEDVFVDPQYRGQGLAKKIVTSVIDEAKKNNCYKLVATSRYERLLVHNLYISIGFEDCGKEFRMNF
jgi:GNAT superfamily N-acetyltransferase